ncbi:hypothetical protein [Mycolicibacterium palauense]|uniref:hypothetical protein n=1 Tax=Mycolicibacterium palauense TaxID=2034511 RepID=UPI000BFEFE5E|nr:hypothetical protein [Mycolicibacterium palauense]
MNRPEPALPAALAARPHDRRRGLPIPFVNETPDGEVDFAAIQASQVLRCARERLCGSCGQPLAWWVAFLGGPESATQRAYLDPGMHPDCAEAALTLCPHIARRHHRRAPEHRLAAGVITPDTMTETKPQRWVMGICRDYEARIVAPRSAQAHVLFLPRPFHRTRTWSYTAAGHLTEDTPPRRR